MLGRHLEHTYFLGKSTPPFSPSWVSLTQELKSLTFGNQRCILHSLWLTSTLSSSRQVLQLSLTYYLFSAHPSELTSPASLSHPSRITTTHLHSTVYPGAQIFMFKLRSRVITTTFCFQPFQGLSLSPLKLGSTFLCILIGVKIFHLEALTPASYMGFLYSVPCHKKLRPPWNFTSISLLIFVGFHVTDHTFGNLPDVHCHRTQCSTRKIQKVHENEIKG